MKKILLCTLVTWTIFSPLKAEETESAQDHHYDIIHTVDHATYGPIFVMNYKDDQNKITKRCISFSNPKDHVYWQQSCVFLDDPKKLVASYTQMMLMGLLLKPKPQRIAMVGMGGGVMTMALQRILPGTLIDAIEIHPELPKIAATYFDFKPDKTTTVFTQDAVDFFKNPKTPVYDLIFLDAFDDKGIVPQLQTPEFIDSLKKHLSPTGIVVVDFISRHDLPRTELLTHDTMFPSRAKVISRYAEEAHFLSLTSLPSKEDISKNVDTIKEKAQGIISEEFFTEVLQNFQPLNQP